MDVSELTRRYLKQSRMMQIATANGDQPWICTVYYVEDENLNLYWLSFPSRRHSQEISKHGKIAVAIPVKIDKPVVGIQAEGITEAIKDKDTISKVMEKYMTKYDSGQNFYDNFVAGKNEHWLYKFTPTKMYLFDEVSFPDGKRHELKIK